MRRTYISTTWTPSVDLEDARSLIRTLENIYSLLRRHMGRPGQYDSLPVVRIFGAWSIPAMPRDSAYSSIEWYVDRILADTHDHILASRYFETVQLEPWQLQNPHFDLCLTDMPVMDNMGKSSTPREVMGVSRRGLAALVSTWPFATITNPSLRRLALEHIFAHYFGCLFDVPVVSSVARAQTEERQGDLYCTNTCAMRFAASPAVALQLAQQQASLGVTFCEACQRDLIGQITAFYYGPN